MKRPHLIDTAYGMSFILFKEWTVKKDIATYAALVTLSFSRINAFLDSGGLKVDNKEPRYLIINQYRVVSNFSLPIVYSSTNNTPYRIQF
ncbi:MAG: hypothetical protein M1332_00885 [Deltaproteobacteria bacterium]|nr:hypothetical protein [Deltaproteobacteria bacterium]